MIKTLFFSVKNAQCVTAELLFLVEYFATSTRANVLVICMFEGQCVTVIIIRNVIMIIIIKLRCMMIL